MTKTIKPCPFCGSDKIKIESWTAQGVFNVYCAKCDCATRFFGSESEALAAWNTRADLCPSGKWQRYDDHDANAWECSLCGEIWQLMEGTPEENHMNYCHNCGAKMSMESDSHE